MDSARWIDRTLDKLPVLLRQPVRLTITAAQRWVDGSGPQLGASIAFYTMFALAPWLVLTIAVAGMVFGAEAARGQIVGEIRGLIGLEAARAVEAMIASAWREKATLWAALLGGATLLVGASGVFAELRRAINAMGGVTPQGPVVGSFVRVRLIAFALLLGFGFLAVASLLLSAAIAAFGSYVGHRWPALAVLATVAEWVLSGVVLGVAFAALMRWLPDRPPHRRGVFIAAVVATALFTLGKHLIGLYIGRASVASSYGAAGSFVVVMLWVYYSAQIMLFGAACGYAHDALQAHAAQAPPLRLRAASEHAH